MDRARHAALPRGLPGLALLALVACHGTSGDDERDAGRDPTSGADAGLHAADDGDGGEAASRDARIAQDGSPDRVGDGGVADAAANGPRDSAIDAARDGGGSAVRDSGLDAEAGATMDAGSDSAVQDVGWEAAALPGLTGVDLSLGGLNADLAPNGNCLSADDVFSACLDVVGEFDGQRFDHCKASSESAGNGLGVQGFGCDFELPSGELLEMTVNIGSSRIGKLPSTFSFAAPPESTSDNNTNVFLWIYYDGGEFSSFQANQDGQVTSEVRISGVAGLAKGVLKNTLSQFERGSFALTVTPSSTCNPASRSCHRVRLRGNFTARTVFESYLLPAGN